LYVQDVNIAHAAGLPCLIDETSWDVQPMSEGKDHLLGTPELLEYEALVADGKREPMAASNGLEEGKRSLVTASGIWAGVKAKLAGRICL
jgi:hypothetical protein